MEAAASSSTAPAKRSWSSLPADLLELTLKRLPWSSHPRFAATCSHWRSVVSPFYPAWITPLLLNAVDVGSTNVRYYSPYFHKNFEIADTLQTPHARICCSSGHRLMLCHQAGSDFVIVDVNLATGVIYDLILPERTFDFIVFDGGKKTFGVRAAAVFQVACAVECEDDNGCRCEFSELSPAALMAAPTTNPVLHRGLLYMLGVDGRLAVHDERRHEEGLRVLDEPKGFGIECEDCYLFESDKGELMAVLVGRRGSPLHVVKLNEQRMEWEKVESLEGRTLFTGALTTMMVKTDVKWMKNKIFMPRLYDWPETVHVKLVNLEGELAFVPKSSMVAENGGADGTKIWTCEFGHEEPKEFWETIKVDNSIWVDFKK
ncbi:hypothetical protein ACP70R_006770 [Stipagrostis hirtigluma subsp. patula]